MEKSIIYQLIPRLWGNLSGKNVKNGSLSINGSGKFSNIDEETLNYLKYIGVSHLWLTGVIEHACKDNYPGCERVSHPQIIKGMAGSPYSIRNYYDVNAYLADNPANRMDEFESLIKRVHDAGLKLIIDYVPNHVSRDYDDGTENSFGKNDNTNVHWDSQNDFFYYRNKELVLPNEEEFLKSAPDAEKYHEFPAKATGNNFTSKPNINDWYDTIKLNYCDFHTATWDKMLDIINFWADKGVDGFRCDMVELVPKEFLKFLITEAKKKHPDLKFIAEIYQTDAYEEYANSIGFDLLYDKSGLYDAIFEIYNKNLNDNGDFPGYWQTTKQITWNWQKFDHIQGALLNFLENHDELRFASDFYGKKAENIFPALYVSALMSSASFMLYFGQEIGERGMDEEGISGLNGRTSIFDWWNPQKISILYELIHSEDFKKLIKDENNIDLESELMSIQTKLKAICPKIEELDLRLWARYINILRKAHFNPVLRDGHFYDLCYCNTNSSGFDVDRHFIFLKGLTQEDRRADIKDDKMKNMQKGEMDKIYLIACNFSVTDAEIDVHIPNEAYDYFAISHDNEIEANCNSQFADKIKIKIPALDARIITL